MTRAFSREEALRYGWTAMKQNFWAFAVLLAIGGFLTLVGGSLSGPEPLVRLLVHVLQMLVGMFAMVLAFSVHDHKPTDVNAFANRFADFLSYLLGMILYALIVVAGLVLLIVPGVVWAVRYSLMPFLIVDKQLNPLDALRQSAALTNGVKAELAVFGLMLIAINLIGAIAFGIGLFATIPTTLMAATFVYRKLSPLDAVTHAILATPANVA